MSNNTQKNQLISVSSPLGFTEMPEFSVFTIAVTGGGARIEASHLDNPTPIIIAADTLLESVPGIVNIFGYGFTNIQIVPLGGPVNVTMSSYKG